MSGHKTKVLLATSLLTLVAVGLFFWFSSNPSTVEPSFEKLNHSANESDAESPESEPCHAAGSAEVRSLISQHKSRSHPLDTLIRMGEYCQEQFDSHVRDYTAVFVKRERHSNQLSEAVTMDVKIRRELRVDGQKTEPLSVYLKFQKPQTGREVIWVEGENDGKLIVHEGSGLQKYVRLNLDPQGTIAMLGNRYPITDIGFGSLFRKLISRATEDRKRGTCQVEIYCHQEFAGRPCTVIEAKHSNPGGGSSHHLARIYIDEEWEIPVKYSAYLWPEVSGGPPVLDEEYLWQEIRFNVGLKDEDFDPDNERYDFP